MCNMPFQTQNVLTVTFDQIIASLLNKNTNLFKKNILTDYNPLNGRLQSRVWFKYIGIFTLYHLMKYIVKL